MAFRATVVFDRVSEVGRIRGGTRFDFESRDARHYAVSVDGFPATLESGMKITALLRQEGDWFSLLGWVNHGTGEIVRAPWLVAAIGAPLAGMGCLAAFRQADWVFAIIAGAVAGSAAARCVQSLMFNRELRAIRRELVLSGELPA